MKEYQKIIKINEYITLKYNINLGYVPIYSIQVYYKKNLLKIIRFNMWDDYGFQSYYSVPYDEYKKETIQSHSFEKNNLLYIPLLHLLNGDDELIIDDDETYEIEKKYMKIYINNEKINIDFINNLDKDLAYERFYVFIKNTGPDLRSKIDCFEKDTKDRLYLFFREVSALFEEDYHQMTIEEYMINNNILTKEESKKYIKRYKKRSLI